MIQKLQEKDIDEVAQLHKQELSGFLPELGIGFLKKFYKATLSVPEMFIFVIKANDHICGFVMGIPRTKGLYKKVILTDIFGFGILLMNYFITHPTSFMKYIKLLAYPGFSKDSPELLTIAIGKKYRGRGFGRKLFHKTVAEFRKKGIPYFRISAYDRLAANGFYKKMGCRKETSFEFLGEKMNYYRYEV
mgnify:CR=1 FL=1